MRNFRIAAVIAATLAATSVISPATAFADPAPAVPAAADAAIAKQHYERGKQLAADNKFTEAYVEFSAGYDLSHRPAFLFNMGECQRALGDKVHARDLYSRFLATNPTGDLEVTARARLVELTPPAPAPVAAPTPLPAPTPVVVHPTPVVVTPTPAPVPAPMPVLPTPQAAAQSAVLTPRPVLTITEQPSEPLYQRKVFWISVGAAVVVGTVAILVATHHGGDSCSPPGCVDLR